jgi:peptidylprolyl isomerase domain and WD repeat-containing protein 1
MIGTSKTRDSTGFELFITTAPIPDLNDKILVFGRAVKGEDVVQVQSICFMIYLLLFLPSVSYWINHLCAMFHQEIEEVDTDEHYRPKSPVGIIGVTLKREI